MAFFRFWAESHGNFPKFVSVSSPGKPRGMIYPVAICPLLLHTCCHGGVHHSRGEFRLFRYLFPCPEGQHGVQINPHSSCLTLLDDRVQSIATAASSAAQILVGSCGIQ
jgi:hypothetical protein